MRHIVVKTTPDTVKYFDPLNPWLVIRCVNDKRTVIAKCPSQRAAQRKIRKILCQYKQDKIEDQK